MRKEELIALELLEWFQENSRSFPWREEKSPYRVLVSEIMLQQTQARRVIPYFTRWMERYPTIQHLADASEEEVIHLWEGLGYYSRARSLHKAARYIVERMNGIIPSTKEELLQIPGIGPYTVGAILSFGFSKPTPAIDANVLRVIARLYNIEGVVTKQSVKKEIEQIVASLLKYGPSDGGSLMESLIEFGALICASGASSPSCSACPLKEVCVSCQQGIQQKRPVIAAKKERIELHRLVFVFYVRKSRELLVVKRSGKKIMSGLCEFPFIEMSAEEASRLLGDEYEDHVAQYINKHYDMAWSRIEKLPIASHGFTRFRAKLYPFQVEIEAPFSLKMEGEDTPLWISSHQIDSLPFSSGHKRVSQALERRDSLFVRSR